MAAHVPPFQLGQGNNMCFINNNIERLVIWGKSICLAGPKNIHNRPTEEIGTLRFIERECDKESIQ